jgi:hypothetical protein
MAGYSGTPLARKLGIKESSSVLVDGTPVGFVLDGVAAGAEPWDVILCFCPDLARLEERWPVLHRATTTPGALWIAWPKRSSGVPTDLTGDVVREYALSHGRVDVKVCAVDDTWSALKNVIRVADR